MLFYLFFLIIFMLIDILIYRKIKKNFFINFIKISFPIFFFLHFFYFEYFEIDNMTRILLLINFLLFLFAYHLFFMGIKKKSPSLFIISQLKKKNFSYKEIKKIFLRENFFYSRFKENIDQNLIGKSKNKIYLKKKAINILRTLNLLKFILRV